MANMLNSTISMRQPTQFHLKVDPPLPNLLAANSTSLILSGLAHLLLSGFSRHFLLSALKGRLTTSSILSPQNAPILT
jgi:hypothetical protein